jgi:hypothetical protein
MKKAIKNLTAVPTPAKSRVIERPQSTETAASEQSIESRLRDLSAFIADLTDSGYGVLLAEDSATREAFDELRVKELVLRWIVRVAKHSNGAVREKLWADIEDAITGLEKTADSLLRYDFAWAHSAPRVHQGILAGPGRF